VLELQIMEPDSGAPNAELAEPVVEAPSSARPTLTIRDLEARLRRYNSDLDPESETFKAACILMAGVAFGHNVDLLARRTGYARPLVSRVIRRLIDNGVWQGGRSEVDWSVEDEASGTFWNDVAVAEGKMCRRSGADGRTEWAPAGFWNKSFQYGDDASRLSTLYLDPDAPEAAADPGDSGNDAETGASGSTAIPTDELESASVVRASGETVSKPLPPATPQIGARNDLGTVIVGPDGASASPSANGAARPGRSTVPAIEELFGNVVWIG